MENENAPIEIFDAGIQIELGELLSKLADANIAITTDATDGNKTLAQRIFVAEGDADRAGAIVLDYFEAQGVETEDMAPAIAPDDDALVVVFETVNPVDVAYVKSILQDAGIEVRESKQGWAQAYGLAYGPGSVTQLLVLGSKAAEAGRIIDAYSPELDSSSSIG